MVSTLAAQLAPLIGLDEQTVSEQILPHLESIKSQNEIKNYLQTLLAPGTKSQSFIQQYLLQRFSPSQPTPPPSSSSITKGWATPPQSRSTSQVRAGGQGVYEREKRKDGLQAAFEGGGQGGRVYRKGQEDLGGWGGGATSRGTNETRASNSTSIPTSTSTTTKGIAKQSSTPSTVILPSSASSSSSAGGLELSEEATKELIEIDRSLKSFKPLPHGKTPRSCFCQARQHPLSPYTPLCKSCGLILCTLNLPSSNRCPSCSNSPLLPPKLIDSYIADLNSRRTSLLDRARIQAEQRKEREEAERKAIRFPELGADFRPQPTSGVGAGGGYAGHAGGGMGMQERIQRAYETGISLNGKPMVEKKGDVGGKVLRLDGKGKVRVQTKRAVPSGKKEGKKEKEGVEVEVMEEEEDGLVGWIDPNDDGISFSSLSTSNSNSIRKEEGRPFRNTSREEELKWVEREELSHSLLDDQDGQELVESVPDSMRAERMRRLVVGAGEQVEGTAGKGAKGGGGGGKGVKK